MKSECLCFLPQKEIPVNWHCYVQCKHAISDGTAYLQITVSLYIALKMLQWIPLLQIFHTEKCLDLSRGKKNILFELVPCLDCELDEKNGIIVTITSVIKFGFCPSLQLILTCDSLEYTEAFTLIFQMQKPRFSVRELSPSSRFVMESYFERKKSLNTIPETCTSTWILFQPTLIRAWLIPFLKHI